ncbi:MAG: GatB/YqeY domain-containing protein [Pyrinomonadaceae bacterium]
MSPKERIINDLSTAMKAREVLRTSTLRMVKAALMNREIEKRSELTDDETLSMLRSLVKQRQDSVEQYTQGGRAELAAKESAEIEIIEAYLPQSATMEEITLAVEQAMTETGASTPRDMGRVMKAVQSILSGRSADNKIVSELVKARLSA